MEKFIFDKIKIAYSIIIFLMFLFLVSCSRANNEDAKWDEDTSTYVLDELHLKYTLPSNAEYWMIRGDMEAFKEIKFCGVDIKNNVCVSILTPTVASSSEKKLTSEEIGRIINELIFGKEDNHLQLDQVVITKKTYLNNESWFFEALVPFENNSMLVKYMGYLFDNNNILTSIMINTPNNDIEHITPESLDSYFSALDVVKD